MAHCTCLAPISVTSSRSSADFGWRCRRRRCCSPCLGVAFEYLVLRPLKRRSHIEVALVTLGLGIILGQSLIYVYGGECSQRRCARECSGGLDPEVLGLSYPLYRIFLIAMGLGSCALLALWLRFTTSGLYVRAVSQDPSVARMMGINADRLSLLVTSLSAASPAWRACSRGRISRSIRAWTSR